MNDLQLSSVYLRFAGPPASGPPVCIYIIGDNCGVYLHGAADKIIDFGKRIIAQAEESKAEASQALKATGS